MAFRPRSLSPTAWVTAEKLTQQVLWAILFAILAPILGPGPYGVFSIVMVFVGFCDYVLSDGAVEALVTADELDTSHMATANLATGVLALLVSLVLFLLGPVVAFAFHDSQLQWLVWSLLPLPVLSLTASVPIAILRRSLQYKQLAIRSIAGLAIGGLFGIVLALAGAGVWALALQVLVQRLAEVVIVWWSMPQGFRLGWSAVCFREMRSVCANVFAARVMTFAGGQVPRLIVGYALGPTTLGFYVLATRFQEIIVTTTVFPRVVVGRIELRGLRPGSPEFRRRFESMAQNCALLAFPAMLGAAAMIPDLFHIWLDQRWLDGAVAAQLVIISGLPLVFTYCLDSAFLAAKQSSFFKIMATAQTVTLLITVLCTVPFGLNVMCLALAIRPWLLLPFFLSSFRRRCDMPASDVLTLPLRSLAGAMIMTAILSLPFLHIAWLGEKLNFALLVLVGVAVYGAFMYQVSRAQLTAALGSLFAHRP
jgi:O-antigen/teichoic acid export membrane protein